MMECRRAVAQAGQEKREAALRRRLLTIRRGTPEERAAEIEEARVEVAVQQRRGRRRIHGGSPDKTTQDLKHSGVLTVLRAARYPSAPDWERGQ